MSKIQVLDQVTIDKIAAGEVVERPASVVKELVENAIDAKAAAVTVEVKEGGISFMRIADNGCGIDREDVPGAFLRHSTSKIRNAEDLEHISSLGFRGEALSSIAAVSQVELITKTPEDSFGTRYMISGGKEEGMEDIGAPDGTTFLVRQLFYNVPARRKFLKTAMTEAGHVSDLMTRMALSHPHISFQFINNGQSKLHTSGNGNLRDVIYHIYGREIAANLINVTYEKNGIRITGYIGAPLISRGNRNFETYFINGRYVKSSIIYKAIEDAYKDFTMQHKYPFTVLHIEVVGEDVDVNVHPTKMEVRFHNQQMIYNSIYEAVDQALHEKELIPEVTIDVPKAEPKAQAKPEPKAQPKLEPKAQPKEVIQPEVNNSVKVQPEKASGERDLDYFMEQMKKRVMSYHQQNSSAEVKGKSDIFKPQVQVDRVKEVAASYRAKQSPEQMTLFDGKLLDKEKRANYKIIGQVFDTYWLVEFDNSLYIIDQHAAHERVLYEKTLREMKTREFTSQMISPPVILNLTMQEAQLLRTYMDRLQELVLNSKNSVKILMLCAVFRRIYSALPKKSCSWR